MKKFFQTVSILYVAFALFSAHLALATLEKANSHSVSKGHVVVPSRPTILNRERLDYSDTEAVEPNRENYTVVAWTTDWCQPCRVWKRTQLPALLKLGYKVKIKVYGEDKVPEDTGKIKVVPTIRLYHKGLLIREVVNWSAEDIDDYIQNRMTLKK